MVKTASTMLPLGVEAPDFSLPDIGGKQVSLADFADAPALLVIFMCNHCPYVKHVAAGLAALAKEYQQRGVAVVGHQPNDVESYPDDSPAKMAEEAKLRGYTFPYLYDETQEVAKAYRAACTPDFFVFDHDRRSWSIAARWTPAGPAATCRSPARTSARRWTPCWPTSPFDQPEAQPRLQHQVEGRATSRIISADPDKLAIRSRRHLPRGNGGDILHRLLTPHSRGRSADAEKYYADAGYWRNQDRCSDRDAA